MQSLPAKDNTMYISQVESRLGDYINEDKVRYDLNVAHEVYLPDSADITVWNEVTGILKDTGEVEKDPLQVYIDDNKLTYEPLKDEEREQVVNAIRAERVAAIEAQKAKE